ncbi:hypothetical protein C8J57DRAFT_1716300 [Mycena rebaudengoi]|nr:hypothetical protein C8J57DRAFT_1716300 [Mycena rebaudengoi]
MMFSPLLLALAAAPALAASLSARQTGSGCSPGFNGHPVSITYALGSDELGVASHTSGANVITQISSGNVPEFLIENSGHFPTSYLIKDQTNHGLVVYAAPVIRGPPALRLNTLDESGADERQYWVITCGTCSAPGADVPPGGVFGTNCQLKNSALGVCVQRNGDTGAQPILRGCTGGENQLFQFRRGTL